MNIIPKIFKIDKQHRQLSGTSTTEDMLKVIIRAAYAKMEIMPGQDDLELIQFPKDGRTYYLYLYSVADKQSKWAAFLPPELKNNSEIFNQTKLTLVLFVETEHNLYAAIGGNAFPIIVNFVDHSFGLDIYDRIISIDNDEAFATKSRRIVGQQVGLSEQFRDNYKLINYLQFGKIPKELHIKLSEEASNEYFSFLLKKNTERLKISVGKAFCIHREVDFDTLHQIISELCTINELAPQELLSSYTELRDKILIEELQQQLNNRIFNYIPILQRTANTMTLHFEFDLCSPNNIEAFYTAETYVLKEKGEDKHEQFATLLDKDEIFSTVVLRAYELNGDNEVGFLFYLRGVRIECYRGSKRTTASSFLFHLNAEFNLNKIPIFLVDNKWYQLKDAFVKSLEKQTAAIFRTTKLPAGIMDIPWGLKTNSHHLIDEGDYNIQYDGRENYFVIDTIKPEGIEPCDIIFVNDTEIYMIHVKHSFTARVRELTNQILISARRISQASASKNHKYFDKIYNSILNKGREVNNLSSIEFAELFYNRAPIYVFATASQFADDPLIADYITRYNSNIARFSVTTCASEVRANYGDFKTCQIRRTRDTSVELLIIDESSNEIDQELQIQLF
ncbi:MAG: hypothetical protein EOO43_00315 [Flavobacterium sp.]|nr:MAG: hypothetical protein EOO43_00315 [Flavobacterium sp.]